MSGVAVCPRHHRHKIAIDAAGYETYSFIGPCPYTRFRFEGPYGVRPLKIEREVEA